MPLGRTKQQQNYSRTHARTTKHPPDTFTLKIHNHTHTHPRTLTFTHARVHLLIHQKTHESFSFPFQFSFAYFLTFPIALSLSHTCSVSPFFSTSFSFLSPLCSLSPILLASLLGSSFFLFPTPFSALFYFFYFLLPKFLQFTLHPLTFDSTSQFLPNKILLPEHS